MANVDPRLLREITRSGKESAARRGGGSAASEPVQPVQAVITLRSGPDGRPLTPEATEACVHQAVERARSLTALDAYKLKVFKNLQSFTVEADPEFLKTLIEDDSVDSASLNKP